jgi:hypothetical protein
MGRKRKRKLNMSKVELKIEDVWLEIDYDYTEGEPEVTYYPDGSGCPASPDRVDVNEVKVKGVDVIPIISDFIFEDIENQIHKLYKQ